MGAAFSNCQEDNYLSANRDFCGNITAVEQALPPGSAIPITGSLLSQSQTIDLLAIVQAISEVLANGGPGEAAQLAEVVSNGEEDAALAAAQAIADLCGKGNVLAASEALSALASKGSTTVIADALQQGYNANAEVAAQAFADAIGKGNVDVLATAIAEAVGLGNAEAAAAAIVQTATQGYIGAATKAFANASAAAKSNGVAEVQAFAQAIANAASKENCESVSQALAQAVTEAGGTGVVAETAAEAIAQSECLTYPECPKIQCLGAAKVCCETEKYSSGMCSTKLKEYTYAGMCVGEHYVWEPTKFGAACYC